MQNKSNNIITSSIKLDSSKYPTMAEFARPFEITAIPIKGRKAELKAIRANLARPEVSSVLLLGEAGVGKTAIIEELARQDKSRLFYEVLLSTMAVGKSDNILAARLTRMIDEVRKIQEEAKKTIVLFIDEFHQIPQFSLAAVEAIKPILARSGQFHIQIIGATTFEEYTKYIQVNEPLAERLQLTTIEEPDDDLVIQMLKSRKEAYLPNVNVRREIYNLIVRYANQYQPSKSQPRKSLLILDKMIGYNLAFNAPMDTKLLSQVIYESTGVLTNLQLNMGDLKHTLESRVFGQQLAIDTIINRLYVSVEGLGDESRPQGSFLFTGSTGVGKTELTKVLGVEMFGSERSIIRFDMSEYSQASSLEQFRELISDKIRNQPFSIVLLDEIEKAHRQVILLLLQVLDDGRLSDRYGRQVTFKNSYIIMTTNLAASIYEDAQTDNTDVTAYEKLIMEELRRDGTAFPPELLGRIDQIVPFNPLRLDVLEKIAIYKLKKLQELVKLTHATDVSFDKRMIDYLVKEHFDIGTNGGGGRALARRINTEILSPIAKFLNINPTIEAIFIGIQGSMSIDNKYDKDGDARLQVIEVKRNVL